MFKLESYITPLILSYVDKYIKNLKPEDSQVSLWGGDAVFSNLDLRLDVLERELRLPFTFANGHIHELRIHVPWTKLGSEPVVITINTIECVLKLCDAPEGGGASEGSSSGGGSSRVRGVAAKVGGRTAAAVEGGGSGSGQAPALVSPPTYVQSLINRVLNNMAVVCNNVVLKYVEDDIVLSLNVKSMEMFTVNRDWEKAFVDLSLPELVLRKLVKLLDLTVCLDRRDASGKIPAYQDPLLYRCSLDCRLRISFDSPRARRVVTATRLHLLCDRLDFSVTDRQLPLFLRLVELGLALHANQIPFFPGAAANASKNQAEANEVGVVQLEDDDDGADAAAPEGWGAWMWSYVPNGLSVFVDDAEDESSASIGRPSPVFNIGLYIKSASFVFKVAESASGAGSFSAQKVNFRPLGSLQTEGVFVDVVSRGIDVLNVQMGMTRLYGVVTGRCPCGIADCQEDAPPCDGSEKNVFFTAGFESPPSSSPGAGSVAYLSGSLFDQESPENVGQLGEYERGFEWDEHFNRVTNVAMQARTPAFAMDYFYLMEIPEDFSDKSSGFSVSDLEYSNLKERTVNRIVIGPTTLDVNSGVYHRFRLILRASESYDYEPYSRLSDTLDEAPNATTSLDEIAELEKFVPSRILRLLVIKPNVRINFSTHQHLQRAAAHKLFPVRSKLASEDPPVPKLPCAVVHGEIVDVQRQWAMYPRRVVKAAAFSRTPPSEALLHNSHAHLNVKFLGCGAYLDFVESGKRDLLAPCNLSFYQKQVFFPKSWKSAMQPKRELIFQAPELKFTVTPAQVALLKTFWSSWFDPDWKLRQLRDNSLLRDAFHGKLSLELIATNIRFKTCDTDAAVAYDGALAALRVHLLYSKGEHHPVVAVPVLHGSEVGQEVHSTSFFLQESARMADGQAAEDSRLVSFTVQLPKDASNINVPGVFVVVCDGVTACLDPRLFEWLAYAPRTTNGTWPPEKSSPPKRANDGDYSLVRESQSKVGSGLSSGGPTTQPTESRSKSRGASNVFQDPTNRGSSAAAKGFPDLIADLYPLLHGLNVHIDVGECNVFLPTSAVAWPSDLREGIARMLKRQFWRGSLPDTMAVNLPRISAANDSQKHASLRDNRDIPVTRVDGWSVGSDQFPWAFQVDNYSVLSLTGSRDVEYLVNPGFVSATVAVNSKNSLVPQALQSVLQLNVCVHCDFQPVRFQLSKIQSQLVAVVVKSCLAVVPNIRGLFAAATAVDRGSASSSPIGLAACMTSPEPPATMPPYKSDAKLRKVSGGGGGGGGGASSTADLATSKGLDEDDDPDNRNKNPMEPPSRTSASHGGSGAKVSLWLQTTVPKLAVDVIGVNSGRDWRLNFELEDISSSIDIQEVYSKIKLKIASLNATNYLKNLQTGQWDLGPYEGISICCSDRLTKSVHMPNPKTGIKTLCPHASFSESEDPQSSSSTSQGSFLLGTFTRAQCRNVRKRWTKILRDYSGSDLGAKLRDMFEKSSTATGGGVGRRHISEIDLKIAAFDCVFVAALVDCTCDVFQPIFTLFQPAAGHRSPTHHPLDDYSGNDSSLCESGMPVFCTGTLPLTYFGCSTVRVFVPRPVDIGSNFNRDCTLATVAAAAATAAGAPSTGFGCHRKSGRPSRADDLIVLQVGAVFVSPNVDNPLSRVLLKPDVYNVAQRAGLLLIPGSEVEERQYQVDITGLCLSTGSWKELIQFTKNSLPPMEVTKLKTMSENPALEWNTKVQPEMFEGVSEVIFCPLVSRFDLRVIFAPAIVYEKGGHLDHGRKDVLVAGHSLEVSATTDIEFFIGLHQVSLLAEQLRADLQLLKNGRSCGKSDDADSFWTSPTVIPARKPKIGQKAGGKEARDSGIDSEASTLGALMATNTNLASLFPLGQSPIGMLNKLNFQPDSTQFQPDLTQFQTDLTQLQPDSTHFQPDSTHFQPDSTQLQPDPTQFQPNSTPVQRPSKTHFQPDSTQFQPSYAQFQNPGKLNFQPSSTQFQPDSTRFQLDYTPFDVLLTAGRITVSVYNVEAVPRKCKQPKSAKTGKGANVSTRERPPPGPGPGPGSVARSVVRKRSELNVKPENVSTSTEGSPARVVRNKGKQISSKELELIAELAGYEGSEESLDDGSSDENAESDHLSDHHIIPLFYVLVSQPYTFLKCGPAGQKVELSCFDINLKGSSANKSIAHGFPLLKPENYDVYWLETLPGDPDPKTGIPPALYTLTLTDFLIKPSLSLKLERPLKFNLSISKYEEIANCLRSFASILSGGGVVPATEVKPEEGEVGGAAGSVIEEFTDRWRRTLARFERMSYETRQVVIAFDTESQPQNAKLQVSSSQVSGVFYFKSNRDLLTEATVELFFGGCVLQSCFREHTRTMLGPFSLTAKGTSVWEPWNVFHPFPHTLVRLGLDTVPVAVDQDHLKCLEVVAAHVRDRRWEDPAKTSAGEASRESYDALDIMRFLPKKNASGQRQVWQDDLRIGIFQYTQDADDVGPMPRTNEIVFCKEHRGQPASMTWRYPQPRALVRTEIHPVPFRAASDTSNANWDDDKVEVRCALQHWDVLNARFVTYRVFHLSETEHRVLDLPPADIELCKDLVISHVWRVVMDYTDPDEAYDKSAAAHHRGLVSPLALAACMRVDSCFNPLFVPCLEFLVDFELAKMTLSNYFPRTSSTTGGYVPGLMPYELDVTRPEYQEFLTFSVENAAIRGRHWHKSFKLEVESIVFSELLDFKFLVLQSLVEPVPVHGQISVTQAEDKFLVAESSVDVGALHLRLGRSSIHTLTLGVKAWYEVEDNRNCYFMNPFVICNGTQETLRFGQVDTDESIAIRKNQAHAYSWRTHKSKQVLHVCIEGMKWKWCDPFGIDDIGVQVRVVENKTQKATLILRIEQLNNAQKQIIISGQLTIASRLTQHLEIRVKSLKQHPDSQEPREHQDVLSSMSRIPSFIVQHEDSWYLQVRFAGESNHWSRGIHIDNPATANGTLIELPGAESGHVSSFWCHVFNQPCGASLRKLVLFAPLYIVRTHLPLPLCLEITTPALGQMHAVDVDGNGQEHQIDCPGEPDLTHQLSFRLAPGLDVSSPPLPLSPTMILQASKQAPIGHVDIDQLCDNFGSLLPYLWPYDSEDLERDAETLPKSTLSGFKHEKKHPQPVGLCQPNIELEVSLVQRWPGCQTLLVDVKPWGLLINKTCVEITFRRRDEDSVVPRDAIFAISRLEGTFKLGVVGHSGRLHYSNAIELSSEDWSLNRYWPKVSGVLSRNGHVLCTIGIDDRDKPQVCYLTISAREKEGIRVFTVRPHFVMVNATDRGLAVAAFAVSHGDTKVNPDPNGFSVLSLQKDPHPVPVLFWDVFGSGFITVADFEDVAAHYLKIRHLAAADPPPRWSLAARLRGGGKPPGSGGSDCVYSVVCIDQDEPEPPLRSSGSAREDSRPYLVTSHCHEGSTYFFVKEDQRPSLKLHNKCNFPLYYGQGTTEGDSNRSEVTVHEEADLLSELPTLPSHESRDYTFPFVSERFPEIYEPHLLPKLHLARPSEDLRSSSTEISWSDGIGVFSQSDQFLHIPNCGDIKVHVERSTAAAVHVYLDPVNRVEVSAKEIRSRIKKAKAGPDHPRTGTATAIAASPNWRKAKLVPQKVRITVQRTTDETTARRSSLSEVVAVAAEEPTDPGSSVKAEAAAPKVTAHEAEDDAANVFKKPESEARRDSPRGAAKRELATAAPPPPERSPDPKATRQSPKPAYSGPVGRTDRILFFGSARLKHLCLTLLDADAEVLRLSVDRACLSTRPLMESGVAASMASASARKQEVLVCVADLQLDNQLQALGGHDFPVMLIKDAVSWPPGTEPMQAEAGFPHAELSWVRRDALLCVAAVLHSPPGVDAWHAQEVDVSLKPLAAYVEDTLLYALGRLAHGCRLSVAREWPEEVLGRDRRRVPREVLLEHRNLVSPVRLQRLTVRPVSLLLSVRASLKLFIALDHTPLAFAAFQRRDVNTTWHRLGHNLTMHYLSGALFRAGWVVGSLDLLANPGGFARAISTGMADFFRLPYRGLLHGPWAFVVGVSQGSSSLLRHVSSGTLVSLTNLASSISRNMDRMSLDRGHLERNEEMRRCAPSGIGSGLAQGLTGLGISLLGAVAGIVDHPFQSLQGDAEVPLSTTATAASVISGVGKGLVGIVTKPIGGAAEFVAQTGQGILHGVGWAKVLKRRYDPVCERTTSAANSVLKYRWKMLAECPSEASVFAIEAAHANAAGSYAAAVLLLTPEVLFVVSVDSDAQQQAFPLMELDCVGHDADPTLVCFLPREVKDSSCLKPEEKNLDRIAEFVSRSSRYTMLGRAGSESASDTSSQPQPQPRGHEITIATQFYVNPCLRSTFLTLYQMAQRKVLGKGYPV